jgi:mono/diheme cytochrome c family protein
MAIAVTVLWTGPCTVQAQSSLNDVVNRGEYLARAGDCVSCHTATHGVPFAGGLRMSTPFGYMLSPNITPDRTTGIGTWSAEEFYRAVHDGVNQHGKDMYPVMPYDFYTKATREDVDAIFTYLKTVKPVSNAVEVNHLHFPFNLRTTMAFWRELFFTEGTFRPVPHKSVTWNRGAYLVEGLAHCSDCHSPRNSLGAIEKRRDFNGAVVDGWFALDLTSDISTGLGAWSANDIAVYLKTGTSADGSTALGPMAEVVNNSTRYLSDADLAAIGEYLKAIPPASRLRAKPEAPDVAKQRGAILYSENCSGCHQSRGRGVPHVFPPLAGNGVVLAPNPADILKVVLGGIPARGQYLPMPSFLTTLSDKDIADLANYIRTSWGNSAAANTSEMTVARLRARLQDRGSVLSEAGRLPPAHPR